MSGNSALEGVDVSELTSLELLDVQKCKLQLLDVTKNLALTSLVCNNNELTTLDVSNNTSLVKFYCNDNQLPRINVTANTALQEFDIANNLLSALNIRNNTALTYLCISNNAELSMVDVKYNTELQELHTEGLTAITEMDLTQNPKLTKYSFTNCPNLVNINVCADFTMDNCLFTGSGNNPGLSITNTTGIEFYYVGRFCPNISKGGVVFTISNGGKNGKIVSLEETSQSWSSAETWCSNYGTGWYLPSLDELKVIYNQKSAINSTLSAGGYTTLGTGYYWSSSIYDWGKGYFYELGFRDGDSSVEYINGTSSVRAVLAF